MRLVGSKKRVKQRQYLWKGTVQVTAMAIVLSWKRGMDRDFRNAWCKIDISGFMIAVAVGMSYHEFLQDTISRWSILNN